MKMNTDNNMAELEQMRQQIGELKELLHNQQIVNGRLMRKAMRNDFHRERRKVYTTIILSALCVPAYALMLSELAYPLWFIALTAAFFTTAATADTYLLKRYVSDDIMNCDLTTTATKLVTYKRFCIKWLILAIPLVIIWVGCFVYYSGYMSDPYFISGAGIGAVIGGICGGMEFRKSQKRVNSILRQIEEINGKGTE